ncbi:MAG TPA: MATE family efflux transporter [Aliiroseovarius sp.]|nr:MATE family efflux transporter [Aliiroseovarius sp.]
MAHPQHPKAHLRALLTLGLPLIGSHLAQMSVNVTDTLMLGWYSVEALAGVVLGGTFFFILFIVGSGFAWAVMPMVAAASEEGDDAGLRRVTRMGLWISLAVAALGVPLLWYSAPILVAMGQDPDLSQVAQQYLRINGWGLIPALAVMALKSYLSALEHTRIVLLATLGAVVINGVLNYALIFGHWGAPELGVRGAAIASLALQVATLVVLVAYIMRKLPQHQLFHRFWRPDWEAMRHVFRMGLQIGLTSLAEAGLFSASTVIMGWIGTIELVAHGIALQIISIFFMVHVGLANAATIRAGRAYGRRDQVGLRMGAAVAIGLGLAFSLVALVFFLAIPDFLIGLFLNPNEARRADVLAIGGVLLAVAAVFQLADGAQVMALGLLRGVQDTKIPMLIAALSYWVIGVPMSYLLGVKWQYGGAGVWAGLVIGLTIAGVLMMLRFWRRSSHIARS